MKKQSTSLPVEISGARNFRIAASIAACVGLTACFNEAEFVELDVDELADTSTDAEPDTPLDTQPDPDVQVDTDTGPAAPVSSLYLLSLGPVSWSEAKLGAAAAFETVNDTNSHLVVVSSSEESEWIEPMITLAGGNLWLGAERLDGNFEWVTGEAFDFTNWVPGEPNGNETESFLEMWGTGAANVTPGRWNDSEVSNGWNNGYITEIPPSLVNPVLNPENGHYYLELTLDGPINYETARFLAESLFYAGMRGHLVTITSAEEQGFVDSISVAPSNWIGAQQDVYVTDYAEPDAGWRWVTGELFAYENWAAGQPDDGVVGENAVVMYDDMTWHDDVEANAFILEFENTTSVVAAGQEDNAHVFRSTQFAHPWSTTDVSGYGTEGVILYANIENNGADGGGFADPLGVDSPAYIEPPAYIAVSSRAQEVHIYGNSDEPEIDDPRLGLVSNPDDIRGGRAEYQSGTNGQYVEMVDITFTAVPPQLVRLGIMAYGDFADDPFAIEVRQDVGGAAAGTSRLRATDSVYLQFFDIRNASDGDRFVVSMVSENPRGVSYMGLTFD